MRGLDGGSLYRRLLGQRLSGDDRGDSTQELDEAGGTGVDDARLAQDVELLLGAGDGFLAPRHQKLEQRADRPRLLCLGGVGERADRGQHRALDRLAHCPIGGIGAGA